MRYNTYSNERQLYFLEKVVATTPMQSLEKNTSSNERQLYFLEKVVVTTPMQSLEKR